MLFAALGWAKYAVHRNLVDFGVFIQTAASAFGCFCNPIEGSHWAFHFSPILYPVGLAVALARSPLTLIVLAAVAGALVAPPIYGLVLRERGDVAAARLAAIVTWLYPALAGLVFGDFHENSFAPAAVAWTLYAFDVELMPWTIVFALVTLAIHLPLQEAVVATLSNHYRVLLKVVVTELKQANRVGSAVIPGRCSRYAVMFAVTATAARNLVPRTQIPAFRYRR